jgi:hypothetical protein
MVHAIKIVVLYVGIIAAIQEHAYDHCCGNVSGYIYLNPSGHTLKSLASIEYELGMRSKRGVSESGSRKSQNDSIISRMVLEGSEKPTGDIKVVLE